MQTSPESLSITLTISVGGGGSIWEAFRDRKRSVSDEFEVSGRDEILTRSSLCRCFLLI